MTKHNCHTPMKETAILGKAIKMTILKENCDVYHISAQNLDCGYL